MKIFVVICIVALFLRELVLLERSFRTMEAKKVAWHFSWVIMLTFMANYFGKLIGG